MSAPPDQIAIAIVSACMQLDGTPTFALTEVVVSAEELSNGAHYYLAEIELRKRGLEEPYVHFTEGEAPDFLHSAIRKMLDLPPAISEPIIIHSEETPCLASSK